MSVNTRSSGYQFCSRLCQSGLGGANAENSDENSPAPRSDLVGSGESSTDPACECQPVSQVVSQPIFAWLGRIVIPAWLVPKQALLDIARTRIEETLLSLLSIKLSEGYSC